MKRIIALLLSVLALTLALSSCRTIEDTKPKNDTTNPNPSIVLFN